MFIAFVTSLIFAFSLDFWSQSIVAEVYTLNAFFVVLLIYLSILWYKKSNPLYLYLFAFFSGLGLTNHHTILLLIIILACFLFFYKKNFNYSISISKIIIYFLIGLILYLHLPIRASSNPSMNWGNPSDFNSMLDHITRYQYGKITKVPRTFFLFFSQLKIYFNNLLSQFTIFLLLFVPFGIYHLFKKDKNKLMLLCSIFICYSLFLMWFLNPKLTRNDIDVMKMFYTPSYIIISIFIGIGIFYIIKLCRIIRLSSLSLLLIIIPLTFNYSDNNLRSDTIAYDYGKNILKTLQKNSILFASQDNEVFILAYLKKVEVLRPDVTVYEDLGVVFENIYGKDFFKIPKKEHLDRKKTVQLKILNETDKNVYCLRTSSIYPLVEVKKLKGFLFFLKGNDSDIYYSIWNKYSIANINEKNIFRKEYLVRDIIAQYYFSKGEYFIDEGSFAAADIEFDNATKIGYDIPWVHNNLGMVYESRGLLDIAIPKYKSAILNNPYSEKAHYNLGLAYSKKGLLDEAIIEYEKALNLKKDYLDALNNLGNIYMKKGAYYKAAEFFKQCLSISPLNEITNYNLGIALNETGNFNDAISCFEKAIAINQNYKEAYNNIGVSYVLKGDKEKAIKYWRKALSIDPNFYDAKINLERTIRR